jgi:hypothetical protein
METQLFNDSELFVKQRPTKLTENQENEIYRKLAQEVIDDNWSDDYAEDIIHDLKRLSKNDTGYEMAKELEGFTSKASYSISTCFIEWLDSLSYAFDDAKRENVKRWVEAHNIQPKYKLGTELTVKEHFTRSPELEVGKTIFINSIWDLEAKYGVFNTKDSKRNILINYEDIEKFCDIS